MPRILPGTDIVSEPNVSRRQVLRGGATGFALAASGLLIPEAVRGDAHHHRKHHHPGATGRKNMEFVFIAGKTLTHQIEVWQEDPAHGGQYILTWFRRNLGPGQQETFSSTQENLVLVDFVPGINKHSVFFQGKNPTVGHPTLLIAQCTSWGRTGYVDRGDTYADTGLSVGRSVFVDGFQVKRVGDSPNYKEFFITALD